MPKVKRTNQPTPKKVQDFSDHIKIVHKFWFNRPKLDPSSLISELLLLGPKLEKIWAYNFTQIAKFWAFKTERATTIHEISDAYSCLYSSNFTGTREIH